MFGHNANQYIAELHGQVCIYNGIIKLFTFLSREVNHLESWAQIEDSKTFQNKWMHRQLYTCSCIHNVIVYYFFVLYQIYCSWNLQPILEKNPQLPAVFHPFEAKGGSFRFQKTWWKRLHEFQTSLPVIFPSSSSQESIATLKRHRKLTNAAGWQLETTGGGPKL